MIAAILLAVLAVPASPPPREVVVRNSGGVRVVRNAYGLRYEITTRTPKLIARIAASDIDANARYAAITALSDRALLEELSRTATDESIRALAVARLGEPARPRIEYPLVDGEAESRAASVARLDAARVTVLGRHDPSPAVRMAAAARISNDDILADMAAFDVASAVRLAAVERIAGDATLARLVEESLVPSVRQAAIKRVANPSALRRIALTAADPADRRVAAARLTEEGALARIASNDADAAVRLTALRGLKDAGLLRGVATTSRHADIRMHAAARLDDAAGLEEIARSEDNGDVARAALYRLKDPSRVHAVAGAAKLPEIQDLAARVLTVNTGQAELVPLLDSDVPAVRRHAIERLRDVPTRARVAEADPDPTVRLAALTAAIDQAVLMRIALRDSVEGVRLAALAGITDAAFLARVEAGDRSEAVRRGARHRRETVERAMPR